MTLEKDMNMQDDSRERHSKCPIFDGKDYGWWKTSMQIYIQGSNYECWKVIRKGSILIQAKNAKGNMVDKDEVDYDSVDYAKA